MKRNALWFSIAIILGYWIYSIWKNLLRPGAGEMPDSVRTIAFVVSIKAPIAVAAIYFLLRANGERLAELGLSPRLLPSSLLRGFLYALGLFAVGNVLLASLLSALAPGGRSDMLRGLFTDPREAPLWIFAAIVGGGFSEELIRAFVLTRFERLLGRPGLVFAVLADSVMFGIGHSYQGPGAIANAGLTGLLLALIFLRRRRVYDAMVTHAVFDLLGIARAYALYAH